MLAGTGGVGVASAPVGADWPEHKGHGCTPAARLAGLLFLGLVVILDGLVSFVYIFRIHAFHSQSISHSRTSQTH